MFSVIIPLYNKAPYIEKAIRSVLSQTYKKFELIVIDDGSTDIASPKASVGGVMLSYSDVEKMIGEKGMLIRQLNQGVSRTRNNGVKLAKYDYIAFLDADDWWAPNYLEEMKKLIEEFPQAGIYGSSYYKVKNGKYIPAKIGVESGFEKGIINYFKVYANTMWMPLCTGTVIIPKKIFNEENGFKPPLKLGEDFDLWVRIALKYPMALLNKPLAYYNQDVELQNRAVVGHKFYKAEEHMLFTHYGDLMKDNDFKYLFDVLALYGLLPYYLNNVHKAEVKQILEHVEWEKHEKKYLWYYKRLPRQIVKNYFEWMKIGAKIKRSIRKK
ncbi:MAG: glycosyltransferase family A protein [Paludibacteraceae bacterium]